MIMVLLDLYYYYSYHLIPALIGNKIYKLNFTELNFMVPSSCITANIPIAYQIYTKVSPAIYHSEMV